MFPKPKYPYFVHERHFAIMNIWICISEVAGARFVFTIKGEGHLRCPVPLLKIKDTLLINWLIMLENKIKFVHVCSQNNGHQKNIIVVP